MSILGVVPSLLEVGSKLIDKLIPDPQAKAKAQLDLLSLQQNGELKELETRMSAIVAEASSADPWTSRARPSFLYVFYFVILSLTVVAPRSEEHTSELQSLMRISYAVFCLKKKIQYIKYISFYDYTIY